MNVREIRVRIVHGGGEWVRVLKNPSQWMRTPIWTVTFETMKQMESEQYLRSKGFVWTKY